jgi:hypothetical protein
VYDNIVVYLRLLTSYYLQKESDFFANFIEGSGQIGDFCKREVEPMYKESDHIHIIALSSVLDVPVRVVYMVSTSWRNRSTVDVTEYCFRKHIYLLIPINCLFIFFFFFPRTVSLEEKCKNMISTREMRKANQSPHGSICFIVPAITM